MTLNSSGPISLGGSTAGQSINLELGKSATATVSLNDTDVRTLAGVASGAIIVPTNFYGKSSVVIAFEDQSISDTQVIPDSALAGYQINSNGRVYSIETSSFITYELEQWATPTSVANQYEVYATVLSGALQLTFGDVNTWLSLGTTRDWYTERPTSGVNVVILSFDVRKIGTTTVLDTWQVTLEAALSA
jgi:hypothetical protein